MRKLFLGLLLTMLTYTISSLAEAFFPLYKVVPENGKPFFLGWTVEGPAISYKGKPPKVIEKFWERIDGTYEPFWEVSFLNDEMHHVEYSIELYIDNKKYNYNFFPDPGILDTYSVNCKYINTGYWFDLLCIETASSASTYSEFKSWIITYDGRVLSLKDQKEFMKTHHIKPIYDKRILLEKLKKANFCYGDYINDCLFVVRFGLTKDGKAILGFVKNSNKPAGLAEVGTTIWIQASPKNAFDIFKAKAKIYKIGKNLKLDLKEILKKD